MIYIHIPFCKTRCIYCDFYSTTHKSLKDDLVQALCKELEIRHKEINKSVETIYFGGGTPSLLSEENFKKLFETIYSLFDICENPEITIEANPDDLTSNYINILKSLPFNRLSIGIQSFNDKELQFLGRRHDSFKAKKAVEECKKKGFGNISIDLMYGLPIQSMKTWEETIQTAIDLDIQHISAYHLIYEEGTKMQKMVDRGLISPIDEEMSNNMYEFLIDYLEQAEFIHYEISSFAKPGFISKHNSAYWTGKKYLGIGPSAHSFNGENRSWNVSSLERYIASLSSEESETCNERGKNCNERGKNCRQEGKFGTEKNQCSKIGRKYDKEGIKYDKERSKYSKQAKLLNCNENISPQQFNDIKEMEPSSVCGGDADLIRGFNETREIELLTEDEKYNELILTGLRTIWGVDLEKLKDTFGTDRYRYCLKNAQKFLDNNLLEIKQGNLKLTRKGVFLSDGIMSELMIV